MKNLLKNNPTNYKHLSLMEREEISILLTQKKPLKFIAENLKRNISTISREIKRNNSPVYKTEYRANRAQIRADERKKISHQKKRLKNEKIENFVLTKIVLNWTPEQIAGRLRIEDPANKTNYESIYLYIYKERPDLIQYLARGHRKRHKRTGKNGKRKVKIPDRIMIDERPDIINKKERYGDWEGDTVVSRKSKVSLAVVRERKTQYIKIKKIEDKKAKKMKEAVVEMLEKEPEKMKKSLTFDNGLENALHKEMMKELNIKTYFCNPYHSWEKGGVENGISLIRRYLPKKTDFNLIKDEEIVNIEMQLNNRPRKSLNFKTPLEVYLFALNH